MGRDWKFYSWHKLSSFTPWTTVGKKTFCFSERPHGLTGTAPLGISTSCCGHWFFCIEGYLKGEHVTSSSPNWSSKARFSVFISSASAVSAHSKLTMNLAPGKFDLRFKWIFIQKHRCYLEIITKDGSYVFNKWPRWKLLSRERIFSPASLFPLGLSQLHLPGLSLSPSILSLLR